jgi:hypothetical protein
MQDLVVVLLCACGEGFFRAGVELLYVLVALQISLSMAFHTGMTVPPSWKPFVEPSLVFGAG